ncbi:MAG: chromosomal replication initiator protein DnaA [Clostridiales bacterium]|nr:chromosomal replication initiator protein DnaA [Clostridiales bacterium]
MDTYNDIWNAVLEFCRTRTSQTGYSLWLSSIKIENFENNTFVLSVSSQFKLKIITGEYYQNLLKEAFANVMGFEVELEFVCAEEAEAMQEQEDDEFLNEQFTFENFIEGPSNRFAYRAAIAVAEDPGGQIKKNNSFSNYNPLFIYGKSGLGKTHILNAIAYEVRKKFPDMEILNIRAEDFANEFINSLGKKNVDEFHNKFRNIDVLLVDDIQFIAGKDRTEEEFFHTFNSLIENGKQIVLTSDRAPKEIRSLADRLCTRFENGLLADIQTPEYETRCAIIKHKAELLNFKIDDNVVTYIAEKIKTNIRQLEGTAKKLYAISKISGQAPTIAVAQKIIKDVVDEAQPVPVTIEKIVEEVSRTEGVSVEDIYGKKQKANVSHARKIAMYVIREVTNISYEQIGEKFDKHHATVMYNVQKITEEAEKDPRLAGKIADIISNVKDYR